MTREHLVREIRDLGDIHIVEVSSTGIIMVANPARGQLNREKQWR